MESHAEKNRRQIVSLRYNIFYVSDGCYGYKLYDNDKLIDASGGYSSHGAALKAARRALKRYTKSLKCQ